MDTLDFAILRELSHPRSFQFNVRISNKEVGDAVGLDEETVRQRVRKMQELGILQRWSVAVHPALFERVLMRMEIPPVPPAGRAKALDAIASLGNVYHIFDFYGGALALVLYAQAGAALDRQVALITALAAAPHAVAQMQLPPPTIEMTPTDWRIVQALRLDARAPFATIAERAGVSERTARRSVERMTEGRAIWLSPVMQMERAEGVLSAAVRVFFRDPSKRGPVDARLRSLDGIVFATSYPDQTQLSWAAKRVADIEALHQEVAAAEGVERVQTDIMVRRITPDGWMDEEIARRLKE